MSANQQFRSSSYPSVPSLSTGRRLTAAVLLWAVSAAPGPAGAQLPVPFAVDATCPPHLTRLFAPATSTGDFDVQYLVCRSAVSLDELRPAAWPAREIPVREAFGGASPEVLRSLALLYGGQQVRVARGWLDHGDGLDSFALIAPPPDDSLNRIGTGTLIVRTRVQRRRAGDGGL